MDISQLLNSDGFKIIILSLVLTLASFLIQGNIGISLGDEGFLWYGTIQTALGKIPLRDFQSYDPGRYYWCAAWSALLGPGIMSLRLSVAIFQFAGLCFGLLTLRRIIRSWVMLSLSGFLLLIWMHPRHKFFEPSIAMGAVYFAVRLIENPSLRQHYISGIFVGIAAFFGRNLGGYSFLSFFLLIIFIWYRNTAIELGKDLLEKYNIHGKSLPSSISIVFKRLYKRKVNPGKRISSWLAGIVTGYLPMIIMMILIPGFFDSVMDMIFVILRFGHTNMPIPIPWPWCFDYSQMSMMESLRKFLAGTFYIFLPLFYLVISVNILTTANDLKHNTVFIAVLFVGLIFMHYPFSCADFPHITQSVHPFIIGLLSLPYIFNYNKILRYGLFGVIFIITFILAGFIQPYYQKTIAQQHEFVSYNIAGDTLWIKKSSANLIDTVQQVNKQKVQENEGLFLVPGWSTFYPILQRDAPLWNIYFIIPETDERQEEMIKELITENVNWVILGDVPFGDLDILRFKNTHQILWRHFMDNFKPVPTKGLPDNYQLLHRKPGQIR